MKAVGGRVRNGHGGVKKHGLPAHGLELFHGAVVSAGLAQCLSMEVGHLVTSDHHGIWMLRGNGQGLGLGQTNGQMARLFFSLWGFIHMRGINGEVQAQAAEKFVPVT
jgi:hypothetical protein